LGGRVGVYEGIVSQWVLLMIVYNPANAASRAAIRIQRYTRGYCTRLRVLFYSSVESYSIFDDDDWWTPDEGFPPDTHASNLFRFWNRKRFNANKIIEHVQTPVNPHTWNLSAWTCGVASVTEIKTRLLDICHIMHPASARTIKHEILDDSTFYPCDPIEYDTMLRNKRRRLD